MGTNYTTVTNFVTVTNYVTEIGVRDEVWAQVEKTKSDNLTVAGVLLIMVLALVILFR